MPSKSKKHNIKFINKKRSKSYSRFVIKKKELRTYKKSSLHGGSKALAVIKIPDRIPDRESLVITDHESFYRFIKRYFVSTEAKHKDIERPIYCNMYLIKVKIAPTEFKYYIYDSHIKEFLPDDQPTYEQIDIMESQLEWGSGGGVTRCKGSIQGNFIKEQYGLSRLAKAKATEAKAKATEAKAKAKATKATAKEKAKEEHEVNDISILLFFKNEGIGGFVTKSVTSRTKQYNYSLCGLLLLNNLKKNGMYLNLICSLQKVGGHLLILAENISKHFNKTHIFLRALEEPMPIYIHKGYKFINGKDSFNFTHLKEPEKPEKLYIKSNPTKTAEKKTYYEDEFGIIYDLKEINRIYESTSTRKGKGKGNILMNIKGNTDNGFEMYKDL